MSMQEGTSPHHADSSAESCSSSSVVPLTGAISQCQSAAPSGPDEHIPPWMADARKFSTVQTYFHSLIRSHFKGLLKVRLTFQGCAVYVLTPNPRSTRVVGTVDKEPEE